MGKGSTARLVKFSIKYPMKPGFLLVWAMSAIFILSSHLLAQQLPREQWGAPAVSVSHAAGRWTIAGRKNRVTLNETDLAMEIQAGSAKWAMVASSANDMLVKRKGEEFYLRLADAGNISIVPYDTGFKTGVKISLVHWKRKSAELDL